MSEDAATLRVERVVYGGYGLARPSEQTSAPIAFVPFSLPGELVRATPSGSAADDWQLVDVLETSASRVQPGCPHFGICGGCHLQMGSYEEQLRIKRDVLQESLERAGVSNVPEIATEAAEPWHYRNRIRVHVLHEGDTIRFGYRKRNSHEVFPIFTCPIAAPLLWHAAEATLSLSSTDREMNVWLAAASEVEFFCDDGESKLQITLLCERRPKAMRAGSFERAMSALAIHVPALAGAGAAVMQRSGGSVPEPLASFGASGLAYSVQADDTNERYWIERGGFFQVNRFLTERLLHLVCHGRSGKLAWDLFAGVGLFARVLARSFEQVVAVEANPVAARELAASLRRLGPHKGVQATTLNFLREHLLQRERPDLIVLDPPRAGAGAEVCALLAQLAPREIVYVSCDPTTLGRDLAELQRANYKLAELHLVDLFPQTYHQEAVAYLRRSPWHTRAT